MNDHDKDYQQQQDQAFKFLKGVFGVKPPKVSAPASDLPTVAPLPLSAETPVGKNQPEFWADAPWRLEPDQNEIPLLFLVRDTNIVKPAKGPWRLDMLKIQQWMPGVVWEDVLALLRYRRLSSFHTYLSKIVANLLGLFIGWLFLFGFEPWLLTVAAGASILASLEELALLRALPQWRADVRGLWWVQRGG